MYYYYLVRFVVIVSVSDWYYGSVFVELTLVISPLQWVKSTTLGLTPKMRDICDTKYYLMK